MSNTIKHIKSQVWSYIALVLVAFVVVMSYFSLSYRINAERLLREQQAESFNSVLGEQRSNLESRLDREISKGQEELKEAREYISELLVWVVTTREIFIRVGIDGVPPVPKIGGGARPPVDDGDSRNGLEDGNDDNK